jgi:hypothetical protein
MPCDSTFTLLLLEPQLWKRFFTPQGSGITSNVSAVLANEGTRLNTNKNDRRYAMSLLLFLNMIYILLFISDCADDKSSFLEFYPINKRYHS